jgi:hypothetical protein
MSSPHVAGGVALLLNAGIQDAATGIIEAASEVDIGNEGLGSPELMLFVGSVAPTVSPAPTPGPSPESSATPTVSDPPSSAPTECEGDFFNVDVLTDNFPSETSWILTNTCGDGFTVFDRPQGYFTAEGTLYADTFCSPTESGSQYQFTIFDSFGDGICCSWGNGEYIVFRNSVEEVTGGDFGSSDTDTFGSCEQTPECEESTLGVPFAGSTFFCEDFPSNVCNRDQAKSHCPVTCDACAEYACEDSMLPWVYQGNIASCAQLAGAPPSFRDTACQIEEIAQTCRSTCGSCD